MKMVWVMTVCGLLVSLFAAGTSLAESVQGKEGGKKHDPAKNFARMDADGSGSVTLEEFKAAHEKRMAAMKEKKGDQERPEGAKTPPAPEERFARIDANSDGAISLEELSAARKEKKKDDSEKKKKKNKKLED